MKLRLVAFSHRIFIGFRTPSHLVIVPPFLLEFWASFGALKIQPRNTNSNLFIKGLDPSVDNKALHDTFSSLVLVGWLTGGSPKWKSNNVYTFGKKNRPVLFRVYIGDEILPSYMGIIS